MARENLTSGPDYRLYWTRYYAARILANRKKQSPEAVALAVHVKRLTDYMDKGDIPKAWVPF